MNTELNANKIAIIISLLVLVVFVGTVFFLLGKNTERVDVVISNAERKAEKVSHTSTAAWKTYSCTDLSLKYPADWNLTEDKSSNSIFILNSDWTYHIIYNPEKVTQHSVNNIIVDSKELTINNEKFIRIVFHKYDLENDKELNEIFKANVINQTDFNDTDSLNYWQTSIQIAENSKLVVEYKPNKSISFANARNEIELMDRITESIKLNNH